MFYTFENGKISEDLEYVYSPACKEYKTFRREKACIVNAEGLGLAGYEYISLLSKQRYPSGTKVSTDCRFDSFGAPLIVFSDDVREINGRKIYGLHFEVVAYENGCNIWHIIPDPEKKAPTCVTLVGSAEFSIANGVLVQISVEIKDKKIIAVINGNRLEVEHSDVPENFHVGITACEGINRFYNLKIDGANNSSGLDA